MRVRIKIGWHDVSILFLSHSSKNDAVANDVSDWLKARGHESYRLHKTVARQLDAKPQFGRAVG